MSKNINNYKFGANGFKLLKESEGCKLKPYLCSANVPTIGWGNTVYPNGKKVTLKDSPISLVEADNMLNTTVAIFAKDVNSLLKTAITQNQFDALVDFAYNVGTDIDADDIPEGLGDSTLLKLINANPNNPKIPAEFLKWNKANGKVSKGLITRRTKESKLWQQP